MIEPLPLIIVLAATVVLAVFFAPRLAGFWFTRSTWTLAGADLTAKFKGLLLFGKEGSYLAISPKGEVGSVSFTKHLVGGETVFRLRITGVMLDRDRIHAIETKLDAQPSRVHRSSARRDGSGDLEIDISGPVVSDPLGMEGIATGVLTALGYGDSQRYRISFEGPTDESAVAEYYSQG